MHKHVKKLNGLKIVFVFLWIANLQSVFSQSQEKLYDQLHQNGYENIRIMRENRKLIVSVENIDYRWQIGALGNMLEQVLVCCTDELEAEIVLVEKGLPQQALIINIQEWKNYKAGNLKAVEQKEIIRVSTRVQEDWKKLKEMKVVNRSSGKFDLVVYPEFSFKNTLLKKPFEIQLNIAPALQVDILRGLHFTGQVIFPLINELGYEGNFIRPGFVTVAQKFRLPHNWTGKANAGHFNASRYGVDVELEHFFANERWKWEMNAGLTGSSHFLDKQWIRSELNTLTWFSSLSYFYPRYSLKFKAGAAKYVYGDYGLFASCTRYFRETAFGFYFLLGENNINGGFHVTVPFVIKKRSPRKLLNITVPRYFEMSYDAGTEFRYGQSYGTSPTGNRINENYFPDYTSNEIIHLKK